jgi:hypothetical protein
MSVSYSGLRAKLLHSEFRAERSGPAEKECMSLSKPGARLADC